MKGNNHMLSFNYGRIINKKVPAFSLLEILLIISIIGLLTTAHITFYQRYSQEIQKKQEELMIVNMLNDYVRRYGDFNLSIKADNLLLAYEEHTKLNDDKIVTNLYKKNHSCAGAGFNQRTIYFSLFQRHFD